MKDDPRSATIPVVEEELRVGRREVETGRVRVRTIPEQHTAHISETLLHSEAEIERVPIDLEIIEPPAIRQEGDTTIVPIVEERLVKRLFLVEEVRLTRRVISERLERDVSLRSQRVVIDRGDSELPPTDQPPIRR